ncbi:MAG: NADH-quinone oxidoreductase subunit H [Candidatus Marinimicrobia bacterium]|nr:NADH-quinone oxidoreductase subunit H [Candidatus Neomarinimicrobiota bacterium]
MIQSLANWILSFDILSGLGSSLVWGLSLFIVAALIFVFVAVNAIVLVYVERKVSAFMQVRLGPMRVGKFGVLQTVADALKLLQKEDIIPEKADKVLFTIGPWTILVASVATFAAIPFSDTLLAANMNIGLFYVISISSIVVLGIVMAGWASNNKWSLYGAMRSAAQIISYEIPVGITLVAVVAVVGSLNLQTIIQSQGGVGNLFHWIPIPLPNWYIFHSPFLFLAAFVYMIGATAEINRTPFDIPESESELVAGFMTEFSGLRWALFFLSEYANATLVAFLVSIVFLGGWQSPFASYSGAQAALLVISLVAIMWTVFVKVKIGRLSMYPLGISILTTMAAWLFPGFAIWLASPGLFWIVLKAASIIFLLMWFRWTFPRLRVDQLMYVSWKVILPISLINLMGVAVWMWLSGEIQF